METSFPHPNIDTPVVLEVLYAAGLEKGGWSIGRVGGGRNSRVFRATSSNGRSYAVKFPPRDERRRAAREFAVLSAIPPTTHLAPEAIFVDEHSFAAPVVVLSWLDGNVSHNLPEGQEWLCLMNHYAAIHSFDQAVITKDIPPVILGPVNLVKGDYSIFWYARRFNQVDPMPKVLREIEKVYAAAHATLERMVPVTLCRVDGNLSNFVRHQTHWASVDWEGAGWGDPAFELAELSVHPSFYGVNEPSWQKNWILYAEAGGPALAERVEMFRPWISLWWWIRHLWDARIGVPIPRWSRASRDDHLNAARQAARSIINLPEIKT